jgi:leucyl aminopeptidase (aminopeptidase T)
MLVLPDTQNDVEQQARPAGYLKPRGMEDAASNAAPREDRRRIAPDREESLRNGAPREDRWRIAPDREEALRNAAPREDRRRIAPDREESLRNVAPREDRRRIAADREESLGNAAPREDRRRIAPDREDARPNPPGSPALQAQNDRRVAGYCQSGLNPESDEFTQSTGGQANMERVLAARGARKLIEECAAVKGGEEALVVTDFLMLDVAEAIATAAKSVAREVAVMIMPPRRTDGAEPPACVAAAMKSSDVFFTPVSKSITHSDATRSALAAGARGVMLTQYNLRMLEGGGIDADFAAIKPVCEWVGERWSEGRHVRITAPAGTDITASIEGRLGNPHPGLAHSAGAMTTVPNIEASVSPVEGTCEGVIVADASIPYFGIGVLHQPVRYTVRSGRAVHIDGGRQAQEVARMMADCHDDNVYNIAQLSIGLNPYCRVQGVMLEDEGAYGTCHIGIGTSTLLGGTVKTALHYDVLIWRPTVEIDGNTIMQGGVLLHPLAKVLVKG